MNNEVYKVVNFYALTNGYIFQQQTSPKNPTEQKLHTRIITSTYL